MAYRVTAAEVKEIIDNCTVANNIVETFIGAANEVVNTVFDTTSIDSYKEIERWFSAHLIVSTLSRMTSEEKLGDASVKYMGQFGKNLESTPYGQMVMILDTSGKMVKIGKQSATITAIESFD